MADQGIDTTLVKWLLSGLAAGIAVLGIAIAAYAIGYHRGERHAPSAAAPAAPATTAATTTQAAATTSSAAPVVPTPQLVAAGKALYTADGCSACHSLTGAAGAGPSFKGLGGSTVTLDNGQAVKADSAYLEQSITSPDAQVVKGYHAGIMAPAIAAHDLAAKPADVRALVAFIEAQK